MSQTESIADTVHRIFACLEANRARAIQRVSRHILAQIQAGEFQVSWERAGSNCPKVHTMIDIAREDLPFLSVVKGILASPCAGIGSFGSEQEGDFARSDVTITLCEENVWCLDAVVEKLAPALTSLLAACEAKAMLGENVQRVSERFASERSEGGHQELAARESMVLTFTEEEIYNVARGYGDPVVVLQIVCDKLCPDRIRMYRSHQQVRVYLTR